MFSTGDETTSVETRSAFTDVQRGENYWRQYNSDAIKLQRDRVMVLGEETMEIKTRAGREEGGGEVRGRWKTSVHFMEHQETRPTFHPGDRSCNTKVSSFLERPRTTLTQPLYSHVNRSKIRAPTSRCRECISLRSLTARFANSRRKNISMEMKDFFFLRT